MLYTGSCRSPPGAERADSGLLALIFAASLIVLTLGSIVAHLALDPHATSVDFPPADWAATPPNWTD